MTGFGALQQSRSMQEERLHGVMVGHTEHTTKPYTQRALNPIQKEAGEHLLKTILVSC